MKVTTDSNGGELLTPVRPWPYQPYRFRRPCVGCSS